MTTAATEGANVAAACRSVEGIADTRDAKAHATHASAYVKRKNDTSATAAPEDDPVAAAGAPTQQTDPA
jgi:hypothetical protein